MIKIYDRKNDKMETEKQFGSKELDFLYNHTIGRLMLKPVINPLFSHIYGIYCKSRLSKNKIKTLIADYKIDVDKYANQQYNSFNDFLGQSLFLWDRQNHIRINRQPFT